ncbi:MAG: GNAT family N-acetyltransferase [Ilumatobacter sp.]|nr:GNAT family N-acetyltransferase [Ilumatobacter sp.]
MMEIRSAGPDDFGRITEITTRAFADDPVMRWFFPDRDEYERLHPVFNEWQCRRWHATDSLWVTADLLAMAGWIPPGRPETDVGPDPGLEHPTWRLERFEAIGAAVAANTPSEPHWYLHMLATDPDAQQRGRGAALMGAVFATADADDLPCYLETESEANVRYYRHHGFDVRSEWDVPLDGPRMWGMLRPAGGTIER